MVTYSLRRPYDDLNSPTRTAALPSYASRTATSLFCSPQGHRVFFLNLTLNFFQKPQHRKCITRSTCGDPALAVRWHTIFILSCEPRKSHCGLTAFLRWRPYGTRAANLWQLQQPWGCRTVAPGLLPVILRFLISWIVQSPCGRRNICHHYYSSPQNLTIFNNHIYKP